MSRLQWTQQEDFLIRQLKELHGIQSWVCISKCINEQSFCLVKRTPKQCRDRYINFSRFMCLEPLKEWNEETLLKLKNVFLEHGAKWKLIAQQFPQRQLCNSPRSENSIKNKFYSLIRKFTRRVNNFLKCKQAGLRKLENITVMKCLKKCSESISQQLGQSRQEKEKLLHSIFKALFQIQREPQIEDNQLQAIAAAIAQFTSKSHRKNADSLSCSSSFNITSSNKKSTFSIRESNEKDLMRGSEEIQSFEQILLAKQIEICRVQVEVQLREIEEDEDSEYEHSLIRQIDKIEEERVDQL